jgi:hypothetical protein
VIEVSRQEDFAVQPARVEEQVDAASPAAPPLQVVHAPDAPQPHPVIEVPRQGDFAVQPARVEKQVDAAPPAAPVEVIINDNDVIEVPLQDDFAVQPARVEEQVGAAPPAAPVEVIINDNDNDKNQQAQMQGEGPPQAIEPDGAAQAQESPLQAFGPDHPGGEDKEEKKKEEKFQPMVCN